MKKNSSFMKMSKWASIAFFTVFCCLFANTTMAQVTYTWIKSPGAWSVVGSWSTATATATNTATTVGTPTLTLAAANTNAVLGAGVTGTGIPAGTTIIDISGLVLTISSNATATAGAVSLQYRAPSPNVPLTVAPVTPTLDVVQLTNTIGSTTLDNTYYTRRLQNQTSAAGAGAPMLLSSNNTANAVVVDVNADSFYTTTGAQIAVQHNATSTAGTKFTIDSNLKLNNSFTTTSASRHNILRVIGHALNVLEFGPNSVIDNVGFGAIVAYPQLGTILMNGEIKGLGTLICGTGGAAAAFTTGVTVFGPTSNNPMFNGSTNSISLVGQADVTVNTNVGNTFFKNTAGGKLQFNNFPNGSSAKITFNTANVWNSILRSSTGSSDGITGANLVINADQTTNVGAIEMIQAVISTVPTGEPVINLTVAAGKSVTFGDSSANVWSAGSKLNIYGFDAATSIKFGSNNAALTSTQLGMIVIKDGASIGQAVGLDATGKLVLASLSIKDKFAQFGFKSYPNPTKNVLNIAAAKNIDTVSFFNVLGQKVQSNTINAAEKQLDISNLENGVYLMEVTIDNAKQAYKIVKQ